MAFESAMNCIYLLGGNRQKSAAAVSNCGFDCIRCWIFSWMTDSGPKMQSTTLVPSPRGAGVVSRGRWAKVGCRLGSLTWGFRDSIDFVSVYGTGWGNLWKR